MPKQAQKKEKKPAENSPQNGNGGSYTAKDIYVLEGLEPVRKRPGMYIGSTGVDGLHHLIWEVVDNSIDEAMAGHAKNIRVELLPDNRVAVTDDGRGIPVEVHKQTKKSALETVMTTLHAGGKFGGESYKVSGGLHGVGVSVVCALSTWMRAEVCRDGALWSQEYKRGVPQYKVKKEGKCDRTGTKVIFEPDPEIFSARGGSADGGKVPEFVPDFDRKRIVDHLRQQAFLTKGVKIEVIDSREVPSVYYAFYFDGGLLSFLSYLSEGEKPLQEVPFYVHKEQENVEVETAFSYTGELETHELSFANNIYTPDGGMHLTGFRSALTRSLNAYMRANDYAKKDDENVTAEDVREGMVVIVAVRIREPQFEGQTKARLGNPEARTAVESVVGEALKDFLDRNTSDARKIIEKCLLAAKARKAAKAAKEMVLRKGALEGLTLPGKLADCSSKDPAESELFIVEGDSAGGCFSGDTKVALADGRNLSFKEIVEEHVQGVRHYCYTRAHNGSIAIEEIANPRITKRNARLIEVELDNDERIVCTSDHKFMLRDGSYKEAQYLSSNDSLMPLYRKHSKRGGVITIEGYEMFLDVKSNRWIFTHMISDEYNLAKGIYAIEDGSHRHHKDFSKLNNNPDNIVRLTPEGHLTTHRTHADRTLRRPEVIAKANATRRMPAYRAMMSVTMKGMSGMLRARAKKQWEDPKYKEFMTKRFLEFYRSNAAYRKENNAILQKVQEVYWSNQENRTSQAKRTSTHFKNHPERKKELSELAIKQWQDESLRLWRAEKTRVQWTSEFREKRREAYSATYKDKALRAFRDIYEERGMLDEAAYNELRRATNDKSLLRFDTILNRFFAGDRTRFEEAVQRYNHRVRTVRVLDRREDVYDIEVPGTHNFALASGVFVHNSAKGGRDRRTQAILPLRGKILNVEKARIDKMLANKEIKALVIAIGTAIADTFDIAKLRYHKVVIMTDADVDGAHIRTLLLTLFYRYFRPVVDGGFLYIAQPPLYRVQSGKESRYVYSDSEKDKAVSEFAKLKEERAKNKGHLAKNKKEPSSAKATEGEGEGEEGQSVKGVNIQRYKGLGEMNPQQLWETTMDPAQRMLKQVMVDDAKGADRLFDILMGEEVEPRKQFIQTHALAVKNLDV